MYSVLRVIYSYHCYSLMYYPFTGKENTASTAAATAAAAAASASGFTSTAAPG